MKLLVQLLLFFAVSVVAWGLMGSLATRRDAEVWFKASPGSEVKHLKEDVSYPITGGIKVRAAGGHALTYPNAELISITFERQPSSWPEKLEFAGIILVVIAVWLLIAWPDIRRFRDLLNRKRL